MSSEDLMLGAFTPDVRQYISESLNRVAEYIIPKMPHWQAPQEALRSWLLWYFCQGLLGALFDCNGTIQTVVVGRYLSDPEQYKTERFHRPGGQICFVEFVAAEEPAAFWAATNLVFARHGVPELIMFQRGARNERPRIYPLEKFARALKKIHGCAQNA